MFNILTPTYNREKLIHRVYESLANQTFKEFKWIVIDDASTDHTESLIKKWSEETKDFPIEYYCLPSNQGKPKAVNFGLTKCNYAYTIIADSDDTFKPESLEEFKNLWKKFSNNNIAAIWTLVLDEDGKIKGDKFPDDEWLVNFEDRVLNQKKQITGDKWTSWNTAILSAHPLYSDSKSHIEESQTWNRINKKYDFLCVNKALLTAHVSPNSLITSKKSRKQISRGGYYSAYYGLKDVKPFHILKYPFYREMAFNYVKSWLFYSDKTLRLNFSQVFVSIIIFLFRLPKQLFKKLK